MRGLSLALVLLFLASACDHIEPRILPPPAAGSSPAPAGLASNPSSASDNDQMADPGLHYGQSLSYPDAASVQEALNFLTVRQLTAETSDNSFGRIFGGAGLAFVDTYLHQRFHYLVSPTANSVFDSASDPNFKALNPSLYLWLERELSTTATWPQLFDGMSIDPRSTRVGVIQIGPTFAAAPVALRISTLVHEARHSDCTGGMSRALAQKTDQASSMSEGLDQLAGNSCGHLHTICPPGHPMAGQSQCDQSLWDAYTVEYVFARKLVRTCSNCAFGELFELQMIALDSSTRLLALPPDTLQALITWNNYVLTNKGSLDSKSLFDQLQSAFSQVDAYLDSGQASRPDMSSSGLYN